MQQSFDVLIIGANADGLAAGAALSATGRKVAVLEPTMKVGGEFLTESFLTHHRYNLSGGWLLAEKLAGLDVSGISGGAPRLLLPAVPMAFLFEQAQPLIFYRSVERLQEQVLRGDQDGLARLIGLGGALHESLLASFSGTAGSGRHRLSSVALLTCRQILDSHDLEDKRLRCALTYLPLAFGFDIEVPGSGAMLALCLFALTRLSIVDGGSGLLAAALADRIVRNQGLILESAKVAKIHEGRDARKTVELEDGRLFSAAKVLLANDRSEVPGVDSELRVAESSGDLGPYRIYLGFARKPAGFHVADDRYRDVNSACMVAMGFDSEAAIYGYLHAIRAGPPPFVAGHLTSSGWYDPVEPAGALGLRDGRIWCVACHTTNVKKLRQLPESPEDFKARDVERRPATGALTWQGVLPMQAKMIDPEGFRKSFQHACIEQIIQRLDGLERDDVTFSLTWLPQETNEPLQRIDLVDLMAGTIPHERYTSNQQGVYVNPYARLAAITGLATGTRLAGFLDSELGTPLSASLPR